MSNESLTTKLQELFDLFTSGALTKEEYDLLKAELLQSEIYTISNESNSVNTCVEKPLNDSLEVSVDNILGEITPAIRVELSSDKENQEEIWADPQGDFSTNNSKMGKSKWKYIGIGIILFLIIAGGIWMLLNHTGVFNTGEHDVNFAILENKVGDRIVKFPIAFKSKNEKSIDTLIATINQLDFRITPEGNMSWGQNFNNSINLTITGEIECAYLYMTGNILFIFYTENNGGDAGSRVEKIDLNKQKSIWQTNITGFNLGLPYIVNNYAYVTSIGTVGKINLNDGAYLFQFKHLYDNVKGSFGSFDSIIFEENLTIFQSKRVEYNFIKTDKVIVNEKTAKLEIRKL